MRKLVSVFLLISLVLCVAAASGCKKGEESSGENGSGSGGDNSSVEGADTDYSTSVPDPVDAKSQLDPPNSGDEIAVFETNLGTIKIRLFPEHAPEAVEQFKKLVNEGFYDNLLFYSIQKDYWLQVGDPLYISAEIDDTSKSDPGEETDVTLSGLHHFNGAVAFLGDGILQSSSRLLLVQSTADTLSEKADEEFEKHQDRYTDDIIAEYKENGGLPTLDAQETVFGQIFEGLDVLEEFGSLPVTSDYTPSEQAIITKATIEKY